MLTESLFADECEPFFNSIGHSRSSRSRADAFGCPLYTQYRPNIFGAANDVKCQSQPTHRSNPDPGSGSDSKVDKLLNLTHLLFDKPVG